MREYFVCLSFVSPECCHVFSEECALQTILKAFLDQGRGTGYPFEGVVARLAASDCFLGRINVAPFRRNWSPASWFRSERERLRPAVLPNGEFRSERERFGLAALPNGGAVHKQCRRMKSFSPERSEESASSCTALAAEPADTPTPSRRNGHVIGQNA